MIVVAPVVALTVAAASSSLRNQVGATNIGVVLAIIVVAAALTSRLAGLVTAAVAALSYNFFHTQPYHSLRVHRSADVVIIALLAALGLVVSDITAWRRRRDVIAVGESMATSAPVKVAEALATPHPVVDVWPSLVTTVMDQLRLAECSVSAAMVEPVISRISHNDADGGFVLPARGASIPIVANGETLGYLVLAPQKGITSLWVERRAVVALADHVAIALTYTGRHNVVDSPR